MHASHSSINGWSRCGKAWELEKIKNYPTMPAWWLIGGSAVHSVTEAYDKGDRWADLDLMAEDCLYEEIQKAVKIEPDEEKWLAGGYGRNAQRFEHWNQKVKEYAYQWADMAWGHDASHTFVELDVSTVLPSGIEVKGYVDRVAVYTDDRMVEITDLKTGSTRPDSDQQLGFYTALTRHWLQTKFGLPEVGDFNLIAANYMFKDDTFYDVGVCNWTLDTVDKMAQAWYAGISNEVFLPVRGKGCERCSVADACFLQSGDTPITREYDSLNPNYTGVVNG